MKNTRQRQQETVGVEGVAVAFERRRLRRRRVSRQAISEVAALGVIVLMLLFSLYMQRTSAFRVLLPQRDFFMIGANLNRNNAVDAKPTICCNFATITRRYSKNTYNKDDSDNDDDDITASGYSRPVVQWYPGHIAKAERMLQETIKAVDVVVEVRDARLPAATAHPLVSTWCAGKPRLLVLTHVDAVPAAAVRSWKRCFERGAQFDTVITDRQIQNQAAQAVFERIKYTTTTKPSTAAALDTKKVKAPATKPSAIQDVLFVNAKVGSGVHGLTRAIWNAGAHVQERRAARGLLGRPLRVGILGYPNVGKSALINRLLNRRRCQTANLPGVTRSLQWIRVKHETSSSKRSQEFELLDSPGVIPAVLTDQSDAMLLAACHCIGEAAYDNQAVAAHLCAWLLAVHQLGHAPQVAPVWRQKCVERYHLDPLAAVQPQPDFFEESPSSSSSTMTGEDMLFAVADNTCQGDPEDAARKILQDFRAGRMGPICLQVAPPLDDDSYSAPRRWADPTTRGQQRQQYQQEQEQERAELALETAKARGLVLPVRQDEANYGTKVGKGLFDGW